ncbi:RNA polymerase II-binding domain-containing protein [Aspergillus undulatus]|uniref:RNA polymerase II-binding domain-containing protein n=1 Tax=Aspergillus undulatus TaxID=1810928 RepID=UPI003CCE4816
MASHQVAIAKASLAAGLLRPDPTSVARDEITALHTSLDRALAHCSPANIQTAKNWLLRYVVSSSNRVGLFAKYLVTLSASLGDSADTDANAKETRQRPSVKRKRLHMLYLLNDVFHHTKYHNSSTAAFSTLSGSLQPHIVDLLSYAAAYDREKNPKHHRRLAELLDIWQEHGYFGADYVGKLREVVANAAVSGPVATSTSTPGAEVETDRKSRDVPFVMPPTHGDPSTPYYDLPAGNLIPHIIPNSTAPLRPDMIKPLQFLAGPADEKLVTALKVFLADVGRIYSPGELNPEDGIVDIDELGQTVVRDEITGDILEGETYYGWSRSFCQQMKKRNARGASESRSRSRSPPKRRRYNSASDDSRYRSRSRSQSRRRYDSRSRSRSRSYSPAPAALTPSQHQPPLPPPHHRPNSYAQQGYPPQPPPQMPFLPSGNAFPPPPPPNYQGAWPPPPPPMPNYPNFPPPFPQMQGRPGQGSPQMPPGPYNYPSPGGRGWHQHPPPPPSGRGWR